MKRSLFVLIGICGVVGFFTALFLYPKKAIFESKNVPETVSLPYKMEWNYRQSINACGPYSVAAAMRALEGQDVSSEVIAQETPWRFRGGTLPFGIVAILKKNSLTSEEHIVELSDSEKLAWLRIHLAQNAPIILLGRKSGLLHYVTLMGYAPHMFFMYDPLEEKGMTGMTMDKNGEAPGNVTWSEDKLLGFWNKGGVVSLYRNYAIVVRKD